MHSPHLRSGELCSTSLWQCLHKIFVIFCTDKCLFSNLFVYLVVYLHQYGLMDIYFVLWITIQYYFILLLKLFQFWPLGDLSFHFCVPVTQNTVKAFSFFCFSPKHFFTSRLYKMLQAHLVYFLSQC